MKLGGRFTKKGDTEKERERDYMFFVKQIKHRNSATKTKNNINYLC